MELSLSVSGGFSIKPEGERRQVECFSSAEPSALSEPVPAFTDQAAKQQRKDDIFALLIN